MLQNIKKNQGFTLISKACKGFTLIELLVAAAIMGAISAVSVKLLYDTVSIRSKQYSIENSADSIRPIISTLSSAIQSAQSITFPPAIPPTVINPIKIIGNIENIESGKTPCWQFHYNSTYKTIEQIKDYSGCNTSAVTMTPGNVTINTFTISQTSPITITIGGIYKDSLGEHNINYTTSVTNRLSI